MKKRRSFLKKEKRKVASDDDPTLKLKKKIHEMKVNNLVENFARKISMNNVQRDPVDYSPF